MLLWGQEVHLVEDVIMRANQSPSRLHSLFCYANEHETCPAGKADNKPGGHSALLKCECNCHVNITYAGENTNSPLSSIGYQIWTIADRHSDQYLFDAVLRIKQALGLTYLDAEDVYRIVAAVRSLSDQGYWSLVEFYELAKLADTEEGRIYSK